MRFGFPDQPFSKLELLAVNTQGCPLHQISFAALFFSEVRS
jgi:hypothetical protein